MDGTITPAERAEKGKRARAQATRSCHGDWQPHAHRQDPVEVLEQQNKLRIPELVPIRHGRMLASAFTFYRGAAGIMAADLAAMPSSGVTAQLCGDAHLSNFGIFHAPDRKLVFDVNDFDETLPGPFEWDVKRLVASLAIAGRDREFSGPDRETVVRAAACEYREAVRGFAAMRDVDVWYARLDLDVIEALRLKINSKRAKGFEKNVAKARHKDSLRAFAKLTHHDGERLCITSDPPLIVPVEELVSEDAGRIEKTLVSLIAGYRKTLDPEIRRLAARYRYVHAARKVVGVGSVGTSAWIVLLLGRDADDPLFLQVKEADASVLEAHAGASRYKHHGRRVVEGQRLMQAAGDIFLGWLTATGLDGRSRDFYVRQLWDGKGSAVIEAMSPEELGAYGKLCAWTLARAHARSGDAIAIGAYLGKSDSFDRAMVRFAEAYADQNQRDYEQVAAAAESGRIAVERDV
jgi:uncharacterized protein (DUF2252 family)